MRMTAAKVLHQQANMIMSKSKPAPLLGGYEQCLVCGEIHLHITNMHAEKHGYADRKAMVRDGKIYCATARKLVKK